MSGLASGLSALIFPYLQMKFLLLLPILLFSSTGVFPQSERGLPSRSKPVYQVNMSAMSQLFLNSVDIESDNVIPETITTKNTGGYVAGADIVRTSPSGFLISLGAFYGKRHYNVTTGVTDLSFFDPSIAKELNEQIGPIIYNYNADCSYIKMRLMIGYVFPQRISKVYRIELQGGLSVRRFNSGIYDDHTILLTVQKDDSIFKGPILKSYIVLGDMARYILGCPSAELYFGCKRSINSRILRNVNVGFAFTKAIFPNSGGGSGTGSVESFNIHGELISTDKYKAKDFSLGLRLSVDLGKR